MALPSGKLPSGLSPALQRTFRAAAQRLQTRNKQRILREIDKVARRLTGLSRDDMPAEIRAKVVRQINREGWMEKIIEARFRRESERSYGGRKWAKLAPSTVARKGGQHPKLIDTMDMYNSALEAVSGTFRWNRNPNWNVDRIPQEYAQYHMEGTDRMPARRFFLPPNDREMQPTWKRVFELTRIELRRKASI